MIFIFIKSPKDYYFVPLFHGAAAFIGGIIGLYIIIFKDNISLKIQPVYRLKYYIKNSFSIFLSNIVLSVKDRFSIIIIGATLGMREVAIFDLGIKIMNIFMQVITIANNAVFPKVSREKNLQFVKRFAKYSFLASIILVIIIQPFLNNILNFLSNNLEGTLIVCRILLLSTIILSLSVVISRNYLVAFGYFKYFFYSVIITTIFYVVFIGVAYAFSLLEYVITFAWITVLTYLVELIYRLKIYSKLSKTEIMNDR